MADLTRFAGETRFVEIDVTSDADPLGDDVAIAFVARFADPVDADWHDADWVTGQTWTSGQPVKARLLVGPADGVALAVGIYDVVVRVIDSPVRPWMPAGTLRIR